MAAEEESMVRGTLSLHTRRAKLSLRVSQRINLSSHHFRTAALFARECLDLERLPVAEITDRQRLQHDGLASSAIIAAVCALEAAVNEVRADADAARRGMPVELASHARRIQELWHTIERAPLLNKFDWLLQVGDRAPLERGSEPCQSAADLIVWRNALTHFIAEWDDDAKTSAQLEKRLAGKFPLNPFATGSMFFPYGSLGGGGARWAVQGAVSYLDGFFSKLYVPLYWEQLQADIAQLLP